MDLDEAIRVVEEHLYESGEDECVITRTLERPYGWVFFYDLKSSVEDPNSQDGLIGNGPFFIIKSGEVLRMPTGCSTELFLSNWELENNQMAVPIELAQPDI